MCNLKMSGVLTFLSGASFAPTSIKRLEIMQMRMNDEDSGDRKDVGSETDSRFHREKCSCFIRGHRDGISIFPTPRLETWDRLIRPV